MDVILDPQGSTMYSPPTSPPHRAMWRYGMLDIMLGSLQAIVALLGRVLILCLMLAGEVGVCNTT